MHNPLLKLHVLVVVPPGIPGAGDLEIAPDASGCARCSSYEYDAMAPPTAVKPRGGPVRLGLRLAGVVTAVKAVLSVGFMFALLHRQSHVSEGEPQAPWQYLDEDGGRCGPASAAAWHAAHAAPRRQRLQTPA